MKTKITKFKNFFLVFFSLIFALSLTELTYRTFYNKNLSTLTNRTLLYEVGSNFQNFDNFFKYYPNSSIRTIALYSDHVVNKDFKLSVEYDYTINTNNAGLVMNQNLNAGENIIYIVGDSFTEGQGAKPWFYDLENDWNYSNIKPVNLGILGTGPKQWYSLAKHTSEKFNLKINSIVINILPDDMKRDVWKFSDAQIKCLNLGKCENGESWIGYKFSNSNNIVSKTEYKTIVLDKIKKNQSSSLLSIKTLKEFVKHSQVITDIYRYLKTLLSSDIFKKNELALSELNKLAKGKVFVNVVSQKNLNSKNYKKFPIAKKLINFLDENNFNYLWCDIPLIGYHQNDAHANELGYMVLKECSSRAIVNLLN